MTSPRRVLVDMDGVLADFDAQLVTEWGARWPEDNPAETIGNRTEFEIDELPLLTGAAKKLRSIYLAEGFYGSLPPIENGLGLTAVNEMVDMGHDVRILTSAGSKALYAFSEKARWVNERLGRAWVARLVISRDKDVVDGDILIDDKPEPNGIERLHSWEHVLYDQSFNRHVTDKRRLTWHNWREVLSEL